MPLWGNGSRLHQRPVSRYYRGQWVTRGIVKWCPSKYRRWLRYAHCNADYHPTTLPVTVSHHFSRSNRQWLRCNAGILPGLSIALFPGLCIGSFPGLCTSLGTRLMITTAMCLSIMPTAWLYSMWRSDIKQVVTLLVCRYWITQETYCWCWCKCAT